ncbi:MAG: hypothetical protein ACQERX_00195 [Bacillota bacterium]
MEFVIAGIVLALFIGLYVFTYSLNEKTEKPEGTKAIDCKGCKAINCGERKDDFQK